LNRCKPCNRKYHRDKRASQEVGEIYRTKKKNSDLLRRYGISLADFTTLRSKQFDLCSICKLKVGEKLVVDHSHKTGKVRELLCNPCNRALGYFKDNIQNLERAIGYLGRHNEYSSDWIEW